MKKWSALALAAMIALSACSGGDDEPSNGSTGTSSAAATATGAEPGTEDSTSGEAEEGMDTGAPEEEGDVAFGETFAYEDGLTVSVSQPETFMPSGTSVNGGEPEFVTFRISMVNGASGDVLPEDISVTVGSGGGEAGEVMDPDGGITGPPAEAVAPGGEAAWPLAFGVLDSGDVLVRVQRGIDAEPVTFGG